MNLSNATAIVTGASSGIGAACAKALAAKGCNILINYQNNRTGALETLKSIEALGVSGEVVHGSVADDSVCRHMAAAALERWGRIDVLVNNAGTTKFVDLYDLEALSGDDFQKMYAVNVVGAYQMIRACHPAMKRQGLGAVINVASVAGLTGEVASCSAYAASKGALLILTKSLARVLGPEVRINAVCPGFVETRWTREGMGEAKLAQVKAHMQNSTALRSAASAEDVADTVVWLAEGARSITGASLQIDGGAHLGTL